MSVTKSSSLTTKISATTQCRLQSVSVRAILSDGEFARGWVVVRHNNVDSKREISLERLDEMIALRDMLTDVVESVHQELSDGV